MKNTHFAILFLSVGMLLSSCGGPSVVSSGKDLVPRISTASVAERRVEPNIASIHFAVQTVAAQAEKARNDNATKVKEITEHLREMKVQDHDLQSIELNIREVLNTKNFEAVNRMRLKVLDIKSIGKVVDQLVTLGAIKVEGIEYDVVEREEIYKELLEEATTNARDKAARMADAAGLGKITVLEVREESSLTQNSPFAKNLEAPEASKTSFSGMTVLRAQVSVIAKAIE